MKISTRLKAGSGFLILLAILCAIGASIAWIKINDLEQVTAATNRIGSMTFRLQVLGSDYLLYATQRADQQWHEVYTRLGETLNDKDLIATDPATVQLLQDRWKQIGITFQQFSEIPQEESEPFQLKRVRLANQLFAQHQDIIANVERFKSTIDRERVNIQNMVYGILAGSAIIGVVIALIFFLLSRTMTIGIAALRRATEEIRAGKLNYQMPVTLTHDDEMSSLARSFNDMASKLKESYAGIKKRTQELIAEKAKDDALLQSIGDGVIAIDKTGKIVLVNRAAEQMLGWKAIDMQGTSLYEKTPLRDPAGAPVQEGKRPLEQALQGTAVMTTMEQAYQYVRKDKNTFPAAIVATPIKLNGDVIGAIETFRDVSKEREIDHAKNEFMSVASHQMRTPLTTIRWYIDLLKKETRGFSTPQKKYLRQMDESIGRMGTLITTLLNVSRIELGTIAVEDALCNIPDILDIAIKDAHGSIQKKRLRIVRSYDPGIPQIPGDAKLLDMVLQNLIGNAVKYTPSKGTITLAVARKGEKIEISVQDNGVGIPAEAQGSIFKKFFRADNAREENPEGSGLGLYIVKSLLDQAGAEIRFESKEGTGSTFIVVLNATGMKKKEGTKKLI